MSEDRPASPPKAPPERSPTNGEVQPQTSANPPSVASTDDGGTRGGPAGNPSTGAVAAAVAGYGTSPGCQRVLFGMSTSAAITIAVSRTINYVRERRRAMPRVRSFGRLLALAPASNSLRVHHFLPGIAIGFTAGGTALLTRAGSLERWLSLPFGVGLALTTDELPLLTGRSNPYWGKEHFAMMQAATASTASLGLGLLFLRRGRESAAAESPH